MRGKRKCSAAYFRYISIALNLKYNRNKFYKTLGYWSRDMLIFDFLEKFLGIVSPTNLVYNFLRKMFLMLYSMNWPNVIVWLLLLLEVLGNVCIAIVCFPRWDVIYFKINLIVIIRLFLFMTNKSHKNLNILRTKRDFKVR